MNNRLMQWMAAVVLATSGASASALAPGMVDTFEDGSTNGWASGFNNPNPPVNVANGGPSGGGDRYLLLTASGSGSGGRLVAFSGPQWAGNYVGAGVTAIGMDVNNLGATDLALRLAFDGGIALSANAIHVFAGSGWTHISFSTDPGALTGSVAALSGVTQFRLYHNPSPDFFGPPIAAQLGIDNITAVPEPAAVWLMLSGLAAVGTLVRRRRDA